MGVPFILKINIFHRMSCMPHVENVYHCKCNVYWFYPISDEEIGKIDQWSVNDKLIIDKVSTDQCDTDDCSVCGFYSISDVQTGINSTVHLLTIPQLCSSVVVLFWRWTLSDHLSYGLAASCRIFLYSIRAESTATEIPQFLI